MSDQLKAIPYYEGYVNADCQLYSPLSANYRSPGSLSQSCQQVNALIGAINTPYTGNSTGERLTWLKRRRSLLTQRAAVIAQALKDLGSTDVVDHTAVDIRTISGLVGTVSSFVPGIGQAIGLGVGVIGQVIGGLIDNSGENTARRDEEIAAYKADYLRLTTILDQTNQEIDRLSFVNYSLWGILAILLVVLFVKTKKQ